MLNKSKTKREMYATGICTVKIKVICIICINFLTSSSLFSNILTIYKKASSKSNVCSNINS